MKIWEGNFLRVRSRLSNTQFQPVLWKSGAVILQLINKNTWHNLTENEVFCNKRKPDLIPLEWLWISYRNMREYEWSQTILYSEDGSLGFLIGAVDASITRRSLMFPWMISWTQSKRTGKNHRTRRRFVSEGATGWPLFWMRGCFRCIFEK